MPGTVRERDWVRLGLRGLGQTLITVGLVLALFVVYEVWVTNLFSHAAQGKVHRRLERVWAAGQDPTVVLPGSSQSTIPLGTGLANLYVPRFGPDYVFTVVQGTDAASLAKGPGHYPGTALPGQLGNFALAGHRVGKGEPFLNLDQLQVGDPLVVETATRWFVYRVKGDPRTHDLAWLGEDGIPGREIVPPSAGRVILPVPDHPGAQPSEKLMTMTTCHPKYSADRRMVIHAVLARSVSKIAGRLPRELQGGTL